MRILRAFSMKGKLFEPGADADLVLSGLNLHSLKALGYIDHAPLDIELASVEAEAKSILANKALVAATARAEETRLRLESRTAARKKAEDAAAAKAEADRLAQEEADRLAKDPAVVGNIPPAGEGAPPADDHRTHDLNNDEVGKLAESINDLAVIAALISGERVNPKFNGGRTGAIELLELRAAELTTPPAE